MRVDGKYYKGIELKEDQKTLQIIDQTLLPDLHHQGDEPGERRARIPGHQREATLHELVAREQVEVQERGQRQLPHEVGGVTERVDEGRSRPVSAALDRGLEGDEPRGEDDREEVPGGRLHALAVQQRTCQRRLRTRPPAPDRR